ncbi:MAG: hypothetical protein JWM12_4344 [Ilumatobacteraceae bacterium]|nr:hypothetical protein [Ilumatobacteraceae bacterium]
MRRAAAFFLCIPLLLAACGSDKKASPVTTAAAGRASGSTLPAAAPAGTTTYTGLARNHVDTKVDYPQTPPVGGPHNPVWQTCRFYDQPILNEHGVHSMEHGAVWITYRPDLPADQVAVLKAMEPGKGYLLISPYPGLPANVVATAWGKQLYLDSVSDPRLQQFVAYFEVGPQTPEQGVPCQGGTTVVASG